MYNKKGTKQEKIRNKNYLEKVLPVCPSVYLYAHRHKNY